MELCNIFGYGEIREGHYRSPSTLMGAYNKISDKKFTAVTISDKKEIYLYYRNSSPNTILLIIGSTDAGMPP